MVIKSFIFKFLLKKLISKAFYLNIMKNNKISLYAIIGLLAVMVGGYFYFKNQVSFLENENSDLKEEKKEELKRVRDSAFVKIETLTKRSDERFDSIVNLPPTIKWRKYEVPVYPNRTLDDALDVHSNYKYEQRAKRKN